MKLKMKFYTFCTIILLVQLSKSEINKSLRHYDVIKKEQFIHNIVKRGASDSDHKFNKIREIDFHALGKNFRLILSPKKSLFSGNFKAVEVDSSHDGERLVEINRDDWYEGRVFGESGSSAQVHLEDGVMTGRIQTRNEVYHVEPAWRHLDTAPRDTMVAYRESDVDLSWMGTEEGSKCAAVKETGIVEEGLLHESLNNRSRRSAHFSPIISDDKSPRLTRCPLMLVADYKFYKEMGGSSTKTTVAYLISLVDRVHRLYEETVWTDGQDQGFSGMGFSIKKIVVHTSPTPVKAGSEHYNMLRASWDVRHLLEVFSREPSHRDYCLAHLFTDMAFDGGILGLAYVGSPRSGSVGGVCSPRYFKSGHTLYLNTGLSSSRNHYGQRVITREADLVTAHEFGHNWGSEHDPDIPECSPSASQGGSYLMYTYSVAGYDVNNKKFSPCSLRFIKKVLQSKSSHCFTEPEESFCGNLRVEGEEECDAGNLGSEARDACCDQNCKLRPGALCSDKNSPCCHKCEYEKAGTTCRTANLATCEQEAACSGYSATCPKSQATEDGATCQDQGTCLAGRCAPFCEARGGQSCMCDDGDACHRCCRSSFNATCSVALPAEVLADGTPCYRGLCNGGVCEATSQDVVRFWDIVDDINFNLVSKIFKDNLVMIIIVLSLLVWIPLSCLVSWLDQKRAEADEEEWEWRRQGDLVHPRDRRQVVTVRVPRRSRQENTEIVHRYRDQNQE